MGGKNLSCGNAKRYFPKNFGKNYLIRPPNPIHETEREGKTDVGTIGEGDPYAGDRARLPHAVSIARGCHALRSMYGQARESDHSCAV